MSTKCNGYCSSCIHKWMCQPYTKDKETISATKTLFETMVRNPGIWQEPKANY